MMVRRWERDETSGGANGANRKTARDTISPMCRGVGNNTRYTSPRIWREIAKRGYAEPISGEAIRRNVTSRQVHAHYSRKTRHIRPWLLGRAPVTTSTSTRATGAIGSSLGCKGDAHAFRNLPSSLAGLVWLNAGSFHVAPSPHRRRFAFDLALLSRPDEKPAKELLSRNRMGVADERRCAPLYSHRVSLYATRFRKQLMLS